MDKDTALRLALEALESCWEIGMPNAWQKKEDAITAIKAALEAKDEPVQNQLMALIDENQRLRAELKFNTTPPQRTWVGLTDEEIQTEWLLTPQHDKAEGIWFGRRLEAKLRSKNDPH